MKKILLLILFLSSLSIISEKVNAAIRRYCMVRYITEYGWSKTYTVEVQFMTGQELNEATRTFNYGPFEKYCLIWWNQGEVSILKITDQILTGSEFGREDFRNAFSFRTTLDCVQVNSDNEVGWQIIGKNYYQFVDPREN